MRRVGLGIAAVLVSLGLVFGAVIGAVVGAITVATSRSTTTTIIKTQAQPTSTQASVSRVYVPVSSAANIVRRVGPAVVSIKHTLPGSVNPFGGTTPGGTAFGSGFIIDRQGDIVTNNHVISGANPHYMVTFSNGRQAPADLVGASATYDIAVIRVKGHVPAVARFADSSFVQPGEPVLAIGDALGQFPNTVTSGIVSGLHRVLTAGTGPQDYIQTDAPINHGNSGGPLLDMTGQVIGVNTAIQRSTGQNNSQGFSFGDPFQGSDPNSTVAEGLGFAIPADTASPLAQHLIHRTAIPYLGVCYRPVNLVDEGKGIPAGARVEPGCTSAGSAVSPGSPAARAGIRLNDVIVAVGGRRLANGLSLEQVILGATAGKSTTIRIWRPTAADSTKGRTITRIVTLGRSSIAR